MLKEFKEFAVRGNVVDLAVGVIIGAAFSKIVDSLVKDVLTPPLGMLLARVDLSNMKVIINEKVGEKPEVAIRYGNFVNEMIHFALVAFALFLIIKQINRFRRKPEQLPPTTKECAFCASVIPMKATRCGHCTSELA